MKITKYILSLAAAIGMIAGCQKAEMVQMLPADQAVAPVLADLPDSIKITPLNMAVDSVVFNWTRADFGVSTQVTYAIEVAEAGGSTKAIVSSGITDTTAVLYYETINVALFEGLELLDGVATPVEFYVSAYTGESAKIYSAGVPVNATATAAERDYPKMTVVGDYQGWAPGKGQYVFDFAGTDETYSGIIGFGINDYDMTKNEFKITGTAWGAENGEHSVPEGTEVAAEADKIPLTNGGGSNIAAYQTKKFYHLTFDKKTPQLIKNFAFDQVGVIGVNGDWDNDVVMNFHAAKQRFYADVEFTADGTFKFRADAAWDLEWGVTDGALVAKGGNIEAKAGKYRVYLNLNNPDNITYELNAKAYGIEEGTTPEPEPEPEPAPTLKGWGICGEPTGWADGADIMLTSDGTWHFVKGVELEGELKFRLDGSWGYEGEDGNYVDQNWGLPKDDANAAFAAGVELTLAKGGNNIAVTKGTYDVYLNPETGKAWFITDGSYPGGGAAPTVSTWALIGDFNSWAGDYTMLIEGDFHVAKGFVLATEGKVKFRKDAQWNYKDESGNEVQTNLGGAAFAVNAELPLTAGGPDLVVPAGTYDVYLKVTTDEDGVYAGTAYFMTDGQTPEGAGAAPEVPEPEDPAVTENAIAADVVPTTEDSEYGVMGSFNEWAGDILMKKTSDVNVFVAAGVEFSADGKFKIRTAGTWDKVNLGLVAEGEALTVNMGYALADNGKDINVVAGTYDIWVHIEKKQVYLMEVGKHPSEATTGTVETPEEKDLSGEAWYLVGTINDWNPADATYPLVKGEKWLACQNVEFVDPGDGCKFKAHTNDSWTVNRGGAFVEVGAAIDVTNDGADVVVPAGTYDIYMNFTATKLYVMAPGEVPAE